MSSLHASIKLGWIIIMVSLFWIPEAVAHSPLISGNNEKLSDATPIPNPAKSWAIYGELHGGGEAQYYSFEIHKGQKIHVMLFKSTNPDNREFSPFFALMGPGLESIGDLPDFVEVPAGAGSIILEGEQPLEADYEPFAASSFYSLADLDIDAPVSGTYYIAVYEPERGGSYGLAVGEQESFSPLEWILIPTRLISIYRWEGQNMALILSPIFAVLLFGTGLIARRIEFWKNPFEFAGILAGLLFIGSGFMFLFQMFLALLKTSIAPDVLITVILALIPILLGIGVIGVIFKDREKVNTRKRVYLAVSGIIALFTWAGLLIGPILAILAGIMPNRRGNNENSAEEYPEDREKK